MLDKLKEEAFRIHIEPFNTADRATKVETVITVLSNIVKSYNGFLEVEFSKLHESENFKNKEEALEKLKKDLNLLIVDLDYGSFEAALAPNIHSNQIMLFDDSINSWEKDIFSEFKNNIIGGNFNSTDYIMFISERYSLDDRDKIYKPLFASIGDSNEYQINIKDNKSLEVIHVLKKPEGNKNFFIKEPVKKTLDKSEYSTMNVVVKIKNSNDGNLKINSKTVKEVLYTEKLEHETYPYKKDSIRFDGKVYLLHKDIYCDVNFEDNMYIISNNDLDITAWGETREEAEIAFAFSFDSMYINYALEDDNNLSEEAIILKEYLNSLIKKIMYET